MKTLKNQIFLSFCMDNYDLEIPRIIARIKEKNHKLVLIQLPDGLKPKAKEITDKIKQQTQAEVLIWLGSCYGSCDIPLGLEKLNIDLVVQIGHGIFNKTEGW